MLTIHEEILFLHTIRDLPAYLQPQTSIRFVCFILDFISVMSSLIWMYQGNTDTYRRSETVYRYELF